VLRNFALAIHADDESMGLGGNAAGMGLSGHRAPFAIASGLALTMGELPPDRVKSASGLFALMRNLGGAIGIAACATVVNDRTNLHLLHIAEHLNFSNTELAGWLHRMSSRYAQAWGDATASEAAALKKLWELPTGSS
jgi:DHA2 family multidrug resistance protein